MTKQTTLATVSHSRQQVAGAGGVSALRQKREEAEVGSQPPYCPYPPLPIKTPQLSVVMEKNCTLVHYSSSEHPPYQHRAGVKTTQWSQLWLHRQPQLVAHLCEMT